MFCTIAFIVILYVSVGPIVGGIAMNLFKVSSESHEVSVWSLTNP
jgi:hypothetical protein